MARYKPIDTNPGMISRWASWRACRRTAHARIGIRISISLSPMRSIECTIERPVAVI